MPRTRPCIRHLRSDHRDQLKVDTRIAQYMRTVHGVVHPFVDRIDLLTVLLRIDIDGGLFGGKQVVEGCVEHANDFGAFVVDDRVCFLVPENWDGEPCGYEVSESMCLVV